MKAISPITIILLLAAFAVVGSMDADDQAAEAAYYCSMVNEGVWPAYRTDITCPGMGSAKLLDYGLAAAGSREFVK